VLVAIVAIGEEEVVAIRGEEEVEIASIEDVEVVLTAYVGAGGKYN
jgi:hypothetical protein